jgi:hypothetical protein
MFRRNVLGVIAAAWYSPQVVLQFARPSGWAPAS